MTAKDEILDRVRAAAVPPFTTERPGVAAKSSRTRTEIVEQFAEYAAEYRANVVRCKRADLAKEISNALAARNSDRAVIPADLPGEWLADASRFVTDESLSHSDLNGIAAVVTSCAVAVAETGTVVLDAGPGQGRRAITLVPDHHVCVVFEGQIVDSVPEAVDLLRESALAGKPMTWISGPSATSDIELSRVEGVHGPRHLDILLASEK